MILARKSPYAVQVLANRTLRPRFVNRRGFWGLGAMVHGVELEDCGGATSVSGQYACSLRNQNLINASYDEHPGSYLGDGVYAGTPQAVAIYGGSQTYTYTPPAVSAPPAPVVYSPSLSFTTSRGSGIGQVLQAGDTWQLSIRGAQPGAAVSVYGGKNGDNAVVSFGSIDGAGNWSQSGTITADQVGSWSEQWRVNGAPIGAFSFRVAAPAASAVVIPPAGTPAGATPPAGGTPAGSTPPAGGTPAAGSSFSFLTDASFLGMPNWALLAGVGGLLFLGGGGRGR